MDPLTARQVESTQSSGPPSRGRLRTLQTIGIFCGLSAGAWLGATEAPTKLGDIGVSPVVVSLAMVVGVFARWSLPALIRERRTSRKIHFVREVHDNEANVLVLRPGGRACPSSLP
jgi:hypothetical protein